jgi:hypothetical protein
MMPVARIDEYIVAVRYYEADYSRQEVKEALESAAHRLAMDLDEGDGVLVQVKPKEEGK